MGTSLGAFEHLLSHYDARLLLLATMVSFCGSVIAFRLFSRLRGSRGSVRFAWTMLTGLVAGSGAWATHFLTLLADSGLQGGFMPSLTMASLMVAILFMSAGFAVASVDRAGANQVAGGMTIGLGLSAMHYMGMWAVALDGRLVWEHALVGGSVGLGVLISVGAIFAVGPCRKVGEQLLGGLLLMAATGAVHFLGMAGLTIEAGAPAVDAAQTLSANAVTFGVATIAVLIILGGLGAALIETSATDSALRRLRRLADAAYEGIVVTLDGAVTDCNAAFTELAGGPIEDLRGRQLSGAMLTFDDDEAPGEDERREGLLHPLGGGEPIPVEVAARLMDDGARQETTGLTVLTVRDLRERREAEEKIRYLAEHDGLTGLPNRRALLARIASALERVEASRESLALLCIDLDHFKEANDLHGHHAGDAVLVEVAKRLEGALRAPAFAARLGADEFVVAQVAGGDQPSAAAELAAQLIDLLREPIDVGGHSVIVGGSIGIAAFPHDGRTGDALLTNADMALARAKEDGGDAYRFFKRDMDETIRERRTMVGELREAIAGDQLVLFYQPLARTADGHVCAFEALMRWIHPERGMISPAAFIPVAEESGLIIQLGELALRKACAEAAGWERPLRIAVNLSPLQLHQPDLADQVASALKETGLAAERLELEVTETALFHDYKRALDNLQALKALGVRVAMDDFGTGFSSLSTLQSFPFDKIKIDRSFVENIGKDGRAKVIVRAVVGLGRSLEIPVVAEGVETAEQLDFLREEECAEVQGFALGRPAPADEIRGWTAAGAQPIPFAAAPRKRRSSVA